MAMTRLILCIALCILCLTPLLAHGAAIIGIDFGTEWIKIGIAKSRYPIDIVLNEQAKRKTPTMIGFRDDDRLFGDAAKALSTRFPDIMFSNLKLVLGKKYSPELEANLKRLNLPFSISENKERGGAVDLHLRDGTTFTPEELTAMLLRNVKRLAEIDASQRVSECVITVPPSFNERERQAILTATELAGFKVLAILNEQTAAAIQYAISKQFTEKFTAMIVDIGSQDELVSVVSYTPSTKKETIASLGKIDVLGTAWANFVGGSEIDNRLAQSFAEQFEKKHKKTITDKPVIMAKLKKEATKIKEILSANQETPVIIESVIDDIDFRSFITRKELEELCADIFAKLLGPIERALTIAGLTKDKLNAVEVIGGGVRIPIIQKILKEYFGRDLSYSLNGDESIALGAAFYAAKLSPQFQVAKFEFTDLYPFAVDFTVSENTGLHHLFVANEKLLSKKSITLPRTKDFSVVLQSDQFSQSGQEFVKYTLSDVEEKFNNWEEEAAKLEEPPKDVKNKVKLSFRLSENGFVVLDSATAIREDSISIAAKEPEKPSTESAEKTDEKTEEKAAEPQPPTPTALKREKRVQSAAVKVETIYLGVLPLSADTLAAAKQRIQEFDARDEAKQRIAKARNDLEGYLYDLKDKINDEKYAPFSTDELKKTINEQLEFYDEWLNYGPGAAATTTVEQFTTELEKLVALGGPVIQRYEQSQLRPRAIETCRNALETTRTLINGLEKSMPWVTAEEREDAIGACTEMEAWLRVKIAEQEKVPAYETPIFTDVDVQRECAKHAFKYNMLKLKKRPPPPPKPETTEGANATEAANSTRTTVTGEGATSGDAPAADAEEATSTSNKPTKDEL